MPIELICNEKVNLIKEFGFYYMSSIVLVSMHGLLLHIEFGYRSMKSWLQNNSIEMYSTDNEGKSVVTETLKEQTLLEYQKMFILIN